jgi:Cof subfamily protein (haloacid dehalogenase superfamily)
VAEAHQRYRLLILDVDGTCLTSDKRLLTEVMDAIREAVGAGLHVAFATGRMFEAIAAWVRELDLRTPQICNNGAHIIDPGTGAQLLSLALAPALKNELLDFGRALGVTTVLFAGSRVLGRAHTEHDWLIERNREMVEVVPEAELRSPNLSVEKMLYLDRYDPARVESARDALNLRYESRGTVPFDAQISEPGILNLCHAEARKLNAVRQLGRILGVEMAQIVAVGDGDNDAEVLAAVGLGIAMGNASARGRLAAKVTIPVDNDHAGVAYAIRQVVLGR